jgi:hypothetical protein
MALNNITFRLGQGGLSRPLPGEDYISGLVFYTASLPSGFSSSSRIKEIFSVSDAEALGIKADYNDETAATGSYLVTAVGANGDVISISVTEPFGNVVQIGQYVKTATETTATLVGAAIAAAINAGTQTHGYKAVAATGTVTITARPGLGVYLNAGTPLVATLSAGATIAGTLTAFASGAGSKQAVWHYHISEFFRIQPQGVLYVGFYAIPAPYVFAPELTAMSNFSAGKIRQFGVYKDSAAFASADLTALDIACKSLVSAHKETIALYGADISAVTDISTLADLSALTANTATAVIGQDGAALGALLYLAYGKSITNLGAALGAVALSKVSESIAWARKFNMSNGTELDIIAFANGKLFSDPSISESLLTQLQNYRYLFLRSFVGVAGSYFNENSASISVSSDYAYISDNRTIQKATRGVYAALLLDLNSPLTLNADGTLADVTAAYFEDLAKAPLNQMVRDGELSAQDVVVNPAQNVLQTGILEVTISLLQIGTARNILVKIGFGVTIN